MAARFEISKWHWGFAIVPTELLDGSKIWLKPFYWRKIEIEPMDSEAYAMFGNQIIIEHASAFNLLQIAGESQNELINRLIEKQPIIL
jgi:hypothetical protein